jgi:rhodanese-related sulfurtransferase
MKIKTVLWSIIGVAAIAAIIVGLSTSGGSGVQQVDAAGAQRALDGGAQAVDVRTPGEFGLGHLPGAVNVPLDQLGAMVGSWDRGKAYVVYCASGSRSTAAVQTMQQMGFTDIKHFSAGLQAWSGPLDKGSASAGTIETGGKPVFVEFYTDT